MPFPFFVDSGAFTASSSTTTRTPALPATRANGDYMMEFFSKMGGSIASAPSGWTNIIAAASAGTHQLLSNYRVVTGSDSSPTTSWTTNAPACSVILNFRGLTAAPVPIGANSLVSGDTLSVGNITTTQHNCVAVVGFLARNSRTVATVPSGWTSLGVSRVNAVYSGHFYYRAIPEPGVIAGGNFVLSAADDFHRYRVLLLGDPNVKAEGSLESGISLIDATFEIIGVGEVSADLESGDSTLTADTIVVRKAGGDLESSPSPFQGFLNPHDFFEVRLESEDSEFTTEVHITRKANANLVSQDSGGEGLAAQAARTLLVFAPIASATSFLTATVARTVKVYGALQSRASGLFVSLAELVTYIPTEIRSGTELTRSIRRNLAGISQAIRSKVSKD